MDDGVAEESKQEYIVDNYIFDDNVYMITDECNDKFAIDFTIIKRELKESNYCATYYKYLNNDNVLTDIEVYYSMPRY